MECDNSGTTGFLNLERICAVIIAFREKLQTRFLKKPQGVYILNDLPVCLRRKKRAFSCIIIAVFQIREKGD